MAPPGPGIVFDETMSGAFALDETDPESGRDRGEQEGTELAMHATVTVDDVRAFERDPEHEGHLTGAIEFDPLGGRFEADRGVFKLFAPSEDETAKWMIYEMPFRREGTPYYLAGRKEVRDDPGFDLWADTTTLYTRLHEGSDSSGPIVGAGVLRLGVDDLIDLVSTMRAVDAPTAEDKMTAFTTFGRLFLGELWDSYGRHLTSDPNTD